MLFCHVAIPTAQFERAFQFYSVITASRLQINAAVPFPMAYFLNDEGSHAGHLFELPGCYPSPDGPIAYFELGADLDEALALVEPSGGRVLMGKTPIAPGRGYWALFQDTEGNRLALHSKR